MILSKEYLNGITKNGLDLNHNCSYFNKKLPWQFEHDGFGSWGITKAELVMISPDKYFSDIVELVGTHTELDAYPHDKKIIESMKSEVNEMTNSMNKDSWRYDIPFVLIDSSKENKSGQDGRHRMAVMKEMNIESVPCLYLYKTKKKKKNMHDQTLLDSLESYHLSEMKSANNGKDEKGFFICTNVVAARTGVQKYYGKELGVIDPNLNDDIFYLERPPEEVFSDATMKSFNGAAFTNNHPEERRVTSTNSKYLMKGIVTNPRKANWLDDEGNELLLVDVIVSDEDTIKDIEGGKIQVSAGYSWDYDVIDLGARRLRIKDIRANHLALVNNGRAKSAMILDEEINQIEEIMLDHKVIEEIDLDAKGGEDMANETVHTFSHTGADGKKKILEVRGIEDKAEAKEFVTEFLKEEKK